MEKCFEINNEQEKIKITEEMEIKEIRGGQYECTITFESGEKLIGKGVLAMPGTEKFYLKEICQELTAEEKEIFIKIFNRFKKKYVNSFVELSKTFFE